MRTWIATSAVVVSLLAPLGAVQAPAVAEDFTPGAPFEAMATPTYLNNLVTVGDVSGVISQTENGTISQDYGFTSQVPDQTSDGPPPRRITDQWVKSSLYPESSDGVSGGSLAGMPSATADLQPDGQVDAVYLDTSGSTDKIVIKNGLANGFAEAQVLDTGRTGGFEITAIESIGNTRYGWVLVARNTGTPQAPNDVIDSYQMYGGTLVPRDVAWEECTIAIPATCEPALPSGGRVLAMHAEAPWRADIVGHHEQAGDLAPGYPTPPRRGSTDLRVVYADGSGAGMALTYVEARLSGAGPTWTFEATTERRSATFYPGLDLTGPQTTANFDYSNFSDIAVLALSDGARTEIMRCVALIGCVPLQQMNDPGRTLCGSVGPGPAPSITVESRFIGCAYASGGAVVTQVARIGLASDTWRFYPERAHAVSGESALGAPVARILLPCQVLPSRLQHPLYHFDPSQDASPPSDCEPNGLMPGVWPSWHDEGMFPTMTTTVAGVQGIYHTSWSELPFDDGLAVTTQIRQDTSGSTNPAYWFHRVFDFETPPAAAPDVEVAPLPNVTNTLTVRQTSPIRRTQTSIEPVGILAAPPTVAGAGQEQDNPEFAASTGVGSSVSKTLGTHVGAGVGFDFEYGKMPLIGGGGETEIMLNVQRSVESTTGEAKEITTSEAFGGLTTDDVIVYNAIQNNAYDVEIVESSLGTGLGTTMTITSPIGGITSSASLSKLASLYDPYRPGTKLSDALTKMLSHDRDGVSVRQRPGDPGSYIIDGPGDAGIDAYCDGSVNPENGREIRFKSNWLNNVNPFVPNRKEIPDGPDVLVSDVHQVQTGTGNQEGASFEIVESQSASRVESTEVDFSVRQTMGYVAVSANAGVSFGSEMESSLSQGTAFSSYIGNIPSSDPALDGEAYNWRSFMCQRSINVGTAADPQHLSLWVMNYAVSHYNGSGGMERLSAVEPVSPVRSTQTNRNATSLVWRQDAGTVKEFTYDLEAIGRPDTRSGTTHTYASPKASEEDLATEFDFALPDTLLPNQLYRWRVTGTDFFGNGRTSEWEYFVTDASGTGTTGGGTGTNAGASGAGDTLVGIEDGVLVGNVLDNDTSAFGQALELTSVSPPAHGSVRTTAAGRVDYTPAANWCGEEQVTYAAKNAAGQAYTARIDLVVACRNDVPRARKDRFTMRSGGKAKLLQVLANDLDVDGDRLRLEFQTTRNGLAWRVKHRKSPRSALKFTPSRGFCGVARVKYQVSDGEGAAAFGLALIRVKCRSTSLSDT